MQTLREVLQQAQQRGVAVGHFNISDLVLLKAVFESAQELRVPVIVVCFGWFGCVVSCSQMRGTWGTHFSGRTHFHGT